MTCSIENCDFTNIKKLTRGMCQAHYQRWRQRGNPLDIGNPSGKGTPRPRPVNSCSVAKCGRAVEGHGLCQKHYWRLRNNGGPLVTVVFRQDPFCSTEGCSSPTKTRNLCNAHYNQWLWHNTSSRKEAGDRRRARKQDAFIQDIDRDLLFDVYNGCCYLCGWEIDPDSDWNLEHIVSLAKGGKHCYSNVAPSHPLCNTRKATKTIQEFFLSNPFPEDFAYPKN